MLGHLCCIRARFAATESTLLGIPSFAVSLDSKREDADFSYAAEITTQLLQKLTAERLPSGVLLNVNVPSVAREKIAGTLITVQSRSYFDDYFDRRIDPQGKTYYWMTGAFVEMTATRHDMCRTWQHATMFVSITPFSMI
jgi:5'-nucleotidase